MREIWNANLNPSFLPKKKHQYHYGPPNLSTSQVVAYENLIRFFYSSGFLNYSGESKVLQYFGNVEHNSTVLDAFADVMKVTNHTKLRR